MKTISNEEYAIEVAENISPYDIGGDNAAHYAAKDAALDALEWKDEQHKQEKQRWIDNAAEWFGKYLFDIGYPDDWLRDSPNVTNGKTRFIQAMKGE